MSVHRIVHMHTIFITPNDEDAQTLISVVKALHPDAKVKESTVGISIEWCETSLSATTREEDLK